MLHWRRGGCAGELWSGMRAAVPALLRCVEATGTWQANCLADARAAECDMRSARAKTERRPSLRKIDRQTRRNMHPPEEAK